jgi:hypothetical protein
MREQRRPLNRKRRKEANGFDEKRGEDRRKIYRIDFGKVEKGLVDSSLE